MAFSSSSSSLFANICILFLLLLPYAKSSSFKFTRFSPSLRSVSFQGDAFATNGALHLTRDEQGVPLTNSAGRAQFVNPVHIWNAKTGEVADFVTRFSFVVKSVGGSTDHGDGLTFFMAPFNSKIPPSSVGGFLGLFDNKTAFNPGLNQVIAVEFDTYPNVWDPSYPHVGINLGSIRSEVTIPWIADFAEGSLATAWVTYNLTTLELNVYLTYDANPIFGGSPTLSYKLDITEALPEYVRIGFSAATGRSVETHKIISWEFSSTLED